MPCSAVSGFNLIFQALWQGLYLRWIVDQSPHQEALKKIDEIIERNRHARSNVLHLRRKLQELEQQAEKLGILKAEVKNNAAQLCKN